MKNEEMSNSLIVTIKDSDLEGLVTDFSELALDQLSELEGIAKDVPIVGTVVKVAKFAFNVKDYLFLKKLEKFLLKLKDIPHHERMKLVEKLERDSGYRRNVGEKIIFLLERFDDLEKPNIMANAFKAYLYEKISYRQLQKINYAIDHLFIGDIYELKYFYNDSKHKMDESTNQNLALHGFVRLIQVMGGTTRPEFVELGSTFCENVLE